MKENPDNFPGFGRHHMPAGHRDYGKGRGLIQLYILHSLTKEPKSGYDLIKEITGKTDGMWVPSKGALYPMLKKMEEEKLIGVFETGKRSKKIYSLTEDGEKYLAAIIEHRKEAEEKMYIFRELMFEIFCAGKKTIRRDLYEIRLISESMPPEKEGEILGVLKRCLAELKEVKEK